MPRLGACALHIANACQGALAGGQLFSVFGFGFSAFAQTEAFAVHFENVNVVREPVEDRAGQALCSEGFGPFVEWQVGCDDDRAALLTCGSSCLCSTA